MKHKVIKKQHNYRDCIICGTENKLGVHASFYEMDDGKLVCTAVLRNEHQSYPERVHGGMIAALLDEAIGRTILIQETIWGVTMSLTVKYRKPVPMDVPIKIVAEITENSSRTFKGVGRLFDDAGNLLAESDALYFKVAYSQMEHLGGHERLIPDDVTEFEY